MLLMDERMIFNPMFKCERAPTKQKGETITNFFYDRLNRT